MRKSTKSPPPVRDEPPPLAPNFDPVKGDQDGQREYHAELAENWWPAGFYGFDDKTQGFRITLDDTSIPSADLVPVATIVVNPLFSKENQHRIAWLLSCAPALWRTLRKVAIEDLEHDEDAADTFHEVRKLLWDAAGRNPFRTITESDDSMFRRLNGLFDEALKGGAK